MGIAEHIQNRYELSGDGFPWKVEGMNRTGMYVLFSDLCHEVGCEVGVWEGKNAAVICDSIPDVKLYLVDPYMNHAYVRKSRGADRLARAKGKAHRRLVNKNVEFIEMLSEDAIKEIPDESLDFVYIDAEHHYDMVMLDIILWSRKVRKGGILSGHDYFRDRKHNMGVPAAVKDYAEAHGLKFYVTAGSAEADPKRRIASWFFIKE